jgi:hypothetical protein
MCCVTGEYPVRRRILNQFTSNVHPVIVPKYRYGCNSDLGAAALGQKRHFGELAFSTPRVATNRSFAATGSSHAVGASPKRDFRGL